MGSDQVKAGKLVGTFEDVEYPPEPPPPEPPPPESPPPESSNATESETRKDESERTEAAQHGARQAQQKWMPWLRGGLAVSVIVVGVSSVAAAFHRLSGMHPKTWIDLLSFVLPNASAIVVMVLCFRTAERVSMTVEERARLSRDAMPRRTVDEHGLVPLIKELLTHAVRVLKSEEK